MSDSFTCPECHQSWPYFDVRKKRDPRLTSFRTICEGCCERIKSDASKAGGPYRGEVGSKGGGASSDMAAQLKSKAGRDRMRIVRWLASNGAHGAEDVAKGLSLDADYVSPRLSELVTLGLAEKGPRTALTRRGNPAHVYQLTAAGEAVVSKAEQGRDAA
ncbi:hypothetical protein D1227_06285 [Henriciella mobilis]|uniref:hypothetical protein n=1 Tax=Henriciella mobilis TaxID=2305467 RepID=UPI000E668B20|nr:hypothetical protein [Henriciella mobilis]RIJ15980.1 hypothetical protein D1231_09315 [Henriciella mobilis]RIJ21190.1 hypothetical protein D1227_12855 [Henriciella mobilis]RIJ23109.1 hypothetical protein D1227_06285 [Henriciella mobilis]